MNETEKLIRHTQATLIALQSARITQLEGEIVKLKRELADMVRRNDAQKAGATKAVA